MTVETKLSRKIWVANVQNIAFLMAKFEKAKYEIAQVFDNNDIFPTFFFSKRTKLTYYLLKSTWNTMYLYQFVSKMKWESSKFAS